MELRHLRYFLAVAETLNFSRAASRLRVAQPALSRQIQDLEEQLGFRLFERTTTRVHATEAGNFFRQQAGKLLMKLDIAVTGAQQIAKDARSELRIGTDWSASELFIADAARELHERSPRLAIDFVELPDHEHCQAIRDHRIDVGFVSGLMLAPRKDLGCSLVYTGAVRIVLPMGHALAGQAKIRLRDLADERWIALSEDEFPGFKARLTQFLRPAGVVPKFGRTARSRRGMLAFVGTGEGIALIPELFLPGETAGLRSVATDSAAFEMFAVWSKDRVPAHLPAYLEILRGKNGVAKKAPAPSRRSFPAQCKECVTTARNWHHTGSPGADALAGPTLLHEAQQAACG
jgi:DNA-binding transcriptional LysR family regulator